MKREAKISLYLSLLDCTSHLHLLQWLLTFWLKEKKVKFTFWFKKGVPDLYPESLCIQKNL